MGKYLFIAEKPSVAAEFAKTLGVTGSRGKGFVESDKYIVTWCVGHLVTMSYPEAYDPSLKKWSMDTLPFIPKKFKYELIPDVRQQFDTVSRQLNREDVERIYVCTDSGREGEYIYRLVDMMAKVPDTKDKRRVWIDSQTEDEIKRGIREAKPEKEYDSLSAAAFSRAREDYLMGINFSRVLTLKYGSKVNNFLKSKKWSAISVGRVMTCVLGMTVKREREIRNFVKTPFYRVTGTFTSSGESFEGEWKAVEGSDWYKTPALYKDNGFRKKEDALQLIKKLESGEHEAVVQSAVKKTEKKNPPLLFNLAEIQNTCSKLFKISPDETLDVIQTLYERKLVTYPRTDARVLSTPVSKEIDRNLKGLLSYSVCQDAARKVLEEGWYKGIEKTRYCDDKKITDHYAIIPTGQGLSNLRGLNLTQQRVYEVIVRRFLCIFYPPAEYKKVSLDLKVQNEHFYSNLKVLSKEGYMSIRTASFASENRNKASGKNSGDPALSETVTSDSLLKTLSVLKKGSVIQWSAMNIKEGETSPPKRYNSGSLILAMENAGQLIENEELREQIKSQGIGTSATRADILAKLVRIRYLALNKKTQIITPTMLGEIVYEVVYSSIRPMLDPRLTASWEKGLNMVSEGTITEEEYMDKLEDYVKRRVQYVKAAGYDRDMNRRFSEVAAAYRKK